MPQLVFAASVRQPAGRRKRPSNEREMDERSERAAKRFELPILVAALLVIPVIVIEQAHVGHGWKLAAEITNWTIWIAFASELVVLLALTPERWRWVRAHPLEVVIVVLTPPFFPASLQATRVFRLLRIVRLLRLAKIAKRLTAADGVRYAALLALVTVLGGGAAFAAVERDYSSWDGVWWSISTMTTVGYGDVTPKTTLGRVIGIVVMLVGIGFVAVLTAAIAQRFVAAEVREDLAEVQSETAEELELAEAELLDELREITERLRRVETTVQRITARPR
jgi:voltage-gated potassium channel